VQPVGRDERFDQLLGGLVAAVEREPDRVLDQRWYVGGEPGCVLEGDRVQEWLAKKIFFSLERLFVSEPARQK
jgi:hypothetical protein